MLRLENVSKYYHSNDVVALGLRKVSLELRLGEFVAVTGESGSGKSTLLNVISGLDTYEDGELYVNGEETSYFTTEEWESYRRQYIGFVFQNYNIIDSYSVLENVMVALTIQGYDKETRKARALELIDKVGLSSHVHHKAGKLSGGQKQRVVIARALAKDCPIIVADEPTGNLDSETGRSIISLLQEISKDKLVVVVTHNYDQVASYATRRIRLFDGEVVEDKTIQPREEVSEGVTLANYRMSIWSLMGLAARNLYRTPRRTVFTTIVAMFIALIFMFSFGSYIEGTDIGGSYYGGIYTNPHERRIIVTKFDETILTATDLEQLRNLDDVRYVLEHDVIMDSILHRLYEVDYGSGPYLSNEPVIVNPADMLISDDLMRGRLPAAANEVVVENSNDYDVGDTIYLDHMERYYALGSTTLSEASRYAVVVVGVVKNINPNLWQEYMFFHADFLSSYDILQNAYFASGWGNQVTRPRYVIEVEGEEREVYFWGSYVLDDSLEDNEITLSYASLDELSYDLFGEPYELHPGFYDDIDLTIHADTNFYQNVITVSIAGEYDTGLSEEDRYYGGIIAMNQTTFEQLMLEGSYQASVLVRDSFDAERVIDALKELGYNAIYPAESTQNEEDAISSIFLNIWFGVLILVLMVIMYFVTYAVLRNIQGAKKKDYLVFRSIGASKKDLYKVTNFELVYVFLFAWLLVLVFFVINEQNQIWVIPQYLRYFNVGTYLTLVGILVSLALLLGRRFNQRIFGKSVITALKQE
jgi:ABC-type lipoprotein export system ATPase subunit